MTSKCSLICNKKAERIGPYEADDIKRPRKLVNAFTPLSQQKPSAEASDDLRMQCSKKVGEALQPKPSPLLERLMKRREALVRKALRHAGLGDELAFSAEIETRETGFVAGVEKASRYAVPSHLAQSPRLHVKLTWPVKVRVHSALVVAASRDWGYLRRWLHDCPVRQPCGQETSRTTASVALTPGAQAAHPADAYGTICSILAIRDEVFRSWPP